MIELGTIVKDQITGFEGVAVSRTEYLYGCIQVGVQPSTLNPKTHEPAEVVYFDEQRLDIECGAPVGGPGDVPPPRSTPPVR